MKVIYTKHARKRILERAIKASWVESCIEMPDYEVTKGKVKESYKRIESQTLKVIWKRGDSFIKVISVMWK